MSRVVCTAQNCVSGRRPWRQTLTTRIVRGRAKRQIAHTPTHNGRSATGPDATELLAMLARAANLADRSSESDAYLGTHRRRLGLSVPVKRSLVKSWCRAHRDLSADGLVDVLDSLFAGDLNEGITACGNLFEAFPDLRRQLELSHLHRWLGQLEGWCEIDSTCQSTFTAADLLERWSEWQPFLAGLAADTSASRRRASLVLLTRPVRESDDARLLQQSLANLRTVMADRDPLITKAVSWLLRTLIGRHRQAVEKFLDKHENDLPRIAVRETQTKLQTGRKTPKKTC